MSDDQLQQHKKDALFECHEAEDALAALIDKATKLGHDIQQFGKWLADDPAKKIYYGQRDQHGLPVDQLDHKFRAAMDFDAALNLADEIRAATVRLRSAQDSKKR